MTAVIADLMLSPELTARAVDASNPGDIEQSDHRPRYRLAHGGALDV
ncbi:MAG TPA: hypothetical protein VE197_00100 [Mycobacterium sp.]|nr:hypothetical protein [Mycobacterium sp.]